MKECCQTRQGLNQQPPDHQSDAHPTEPQRLADAHVTWLVGYGGLSWSGIRWHELQLWGGKGSVCKQITSIKNPDEYQRNFQVSQL